MCNKAVLAESPWNVLLVEDDDTVRRQIHEYLAGESFQSRQMNITDIGDITQALNLIRERKADLVILDVYRGTAHEGGEQVGIRVLDSIRQSGFVAVVLYTALPEGLEGQQSSFVRLVGKDAGGLERLKQEITDLFRLRIPQVHRAVVNHIDRALSSYMWDFVQGRWAEFAPIADKPEFLRLVVQRLAMTFAREGIDRMTVEVYGAVPPGGPPAADTVHPAEYYIKPPLGNDPSLGDIRLRRNAGGPEHLVVLWPTCDMVSTGGRTPKTDFVLCAQTMHASNAPEVTDWIANQTGTKQRQVERMVKNVRTESPDRYHFLPGVWDIPDLLVDFQRLMHVPLADILACECIATLASPFAESLAVRFQRYIGRVGTPDLDLPQIIRQLQARGATAPVAAPPAP